MIDKLIEEVFLFLQGKKSSININHIKAISNAFTTAVLRVQKLENTRSYLWANKAHHAKVMLKAGGKHGKVAMGRN